MTNQRYSSRVSLYGTVVSSPHKEFKDFLFRVEGNAIFHVFPTYDAYRHDEKLFVMGQRLKLTVRLFPKKKMDVIAYGAETLAPGEEPTRPRLLPIWGEYTTDFRLRQFRKCPQDGLPEFIDFDTPEGAALLTEYMETPEGILAWEGYEREQVE